MVTGQPPSTGWVTGIPVPAPQRSFRNELLERDRCRERDDHGLTPDAERRDRDQEADDRRRRRSDRSEIGNSAHTPPRSVVRCDIVKPATPASASWTTEI